MIIRRYTGSLAGMAVLALALVPGQLLAKIKPKAIPISGQRKVVLIDFSRAPVAAAPASSSTMPEELPIADVARQMAIAFTNSSKPPDALPDTYAAPALTAASLRNPFITRAVAMIPSLPSLPSPAFNAGGSCIHPDYQPDFSHGRAAEARRRMIYPLVHQVACEQGLPIGLFDALIMQESRYNHTAVSPKGALGLAQLMPGTARQLGANPYAVIGNLRGGARYLRQQIDRFGRYDLALAAYNAGPGRVARYGRVPVIVETTDYVRKISANWGGGPGSLALNAPPLSMRRTQLIFMPYYSR
jgi:soluble lytic murein transglycosylase-like protein